ncbi:MAG: hypothetical protein IH618_05990 [Ignavibacteriaceae bacterium]|nr:hypothetical protein [Ignavibacteriaceae bacterium]
MYTHLSNGFENELEPSEFYLSPNYPNPFKEKTTIKYCVPYRTKVLLAVYNEESNEVIKLVNEEKNPGTYEVEFNACHSRENLPEGKAGGNPKEETLFYRLEAGDYKNELEMTLKYNL